MVIALLDTDILVDEMRKYKVAIEWIRRLPAGQIGVTPIAYMELVEGAPNAIKQRAVMKLLSRFEVVHLTSADFEWVMQQQVKYTLSHNIGMTDLLIASVNHRLQVPLYTRNVKHFTPLLGSLVQKPY